ncbi:X-pro dipeptidyl-peptidase c-terminal non-catalytic domain-containing protein [Colletotrichum higginsianum]|nr:X-pro dipeptidyl-peptidase c-terminal non-catalytic domain-containing protein [Colletotrichum higginsianum]
MEKYPNCRDYWDDKRARMDKIEVPAYILGSFSTMLHTIGSFRGFEEIPHQKKWYVVRITVHATQEWFDLYRKARTENLQKFFDHYLKGIGNGWEQTPPVRLAVQGFNKPPILDLPFGQLPWLAPAATDSTQTRLYLSHGKTLKPVNDSKYIALGYGDTEQFTFTYVFDQPIKLLGPTKLVVSISCPSKPDFDVYAQLRKREKHG